VQWKGKGLQGSRGALEAGKDGSCGCRRVGGGEDGGDESDPVAAGSKKFGEALKGDAAEGEDGEGGGRTCLS
jgi:hypothetical protein